MASHPWSEYRPSTDMPWNLRRVAHLHRRAGFGANWHQLQGDLEDGVSLAIDRLLHPPGAPQNQVQTIETLRNGILHDPSTASERLSAYWLYRLAFGADVLREKMSLFWHNHFATSLARVKNTTFMLGQNELFRKQALGSFKELLRAVTNDPAMLIWLDRLNSPKDNPNENYAREFLELFTLGVGHYSEVDVLSASRAFTGIVAPNQLPMDQMGWPRPTTPEFRFDKQHFDGGRKDFLGQRGNWHADDIIRITLNNKQTARRLCGKLYRYLVSDRAPDPRLIHPLAQLLIDSDFEIRPVVETILRSRHFFCETSIQSKIASPISYSIGLLRQLEIAPAAVRFRALDDSLSAQGQRLFFPPSVKGWSGGRKWITNITMLARGQWAKTLLWGKRRLDIPAHNFERWKNKYDLSDDRAKLAIAMLLSQGKHSLPQEPLGKIAASLILRPEYHLN